VLPAALDAEPEAAMVKRWLQCIAGGGAAMLAVFWIRSASISSPAIELVDSMPRPAALEEVASIEPPPGTLQTKTPAGLKSTSPPRVVPRRKLCATPRRPSGSQATKRSDCAPKTRRSAKGGCAAGCAGR
jgi:hypothetical protein